KEVNIESEDWPYRASIIKEIAKNDLTFELQVQLCNDLDKLPINDLTVEWDQELSPFQTVTKNTRFQQEVPKDGNFEIMENLSFNPFRAIQANSPIRSLQMTRQQAYITSSTSRHALNHKKKVEPKTL